MKVLAIVSAIAVVVLGVAAYLLGSTAVSAGTVEGDSNRLLQTTGADTDFKAAKQASDGLVTRLEQAGTTVADDRSRLAASDSRLDALVGNPWALPVRARLRSQQTRVRSVIAALEAARGGLAIEHDQMRTLSALFDAMIDFTALGTAVEKQDIAGGLSIMPGLQAKLQTAVQLSQAPNNPPQLHDELVTIQTTARDIQALLQAQQRKDTKAAAAVLPRLQADQKALEGYQSSAIDSYDQKLLQPYRDRYEAGLKAAGFQLV